MTEKKHRATALPKNEKIEWILPAEDSVQNVCENFLLSKRAEGISRSTQHLYAYELQRFGTWVTAQGISIYPDLTINHYRAYIAGRLERGIEPRTAHITYRVLRTMSYWYENEHNDYNSPFHKMKAPKLPKDDKQAVTDPQAIEMLLDACKGNVDEARDRLILLTVYDAGLRVSEVANLNVADINLHTGHLNIREGKGNKDRDAYVVRNTRREIVKYLKRRENLENDEPLFPTDEGDFFTYSGLYSLLTRIQEKAGIKVHGWHSLRRGFATEYKNDGGDWGELSKILGHSNIETTKRYVNISDQHLQEEHGRHSPAGKLRRRR